MRFQLSSFKNRCINLIEKIKLPPASFRGPSAKPSRRLLADFPTPCFRGLFRGRFRLRRFRGASAKGVSSLQRYPSKPRAYFERELIQKRELLLV